MLFAFTFFKTFSNPTTLFVLHIFFFSVMCSVKREHNPNASSGSVALAVGVGGKFSDQDKCAVVM